MKKKVGIVTFNNAYNYGAVLQCYALQTFLNDNGIPNEVIDYQCGYINRQYKGLIRIVKGQELKSFVGCLVKLPNKLRGLALFRQFQNRFIEKTPPVTREALPQLAEEYCAFIAGSDQVWSPGCAGFDKAYFLDFAKPEQKYSYAASFGTGSLKEELIPEYRALLRDFQNFSLRERSGAVLTERITKQKAAVHVDPTFLLTQEAWDQLASPGIIRKPYIFVFTVPKPNGLLSWARSFGKEKNLPVYYLNDKHIPFMGMKYVKTASPDQFVGLIKNADYVVTNSFHGVVFSLMYHKKFVVELDSTAGRNNRVEELLEKLHIGSRDIQTCTDPDEGIDWQTVDDLLEKERTETGAYLRELKFGQMK